MALRSFVTTFNINNSDIGHTYSTNEVEIGNLIYDWIVKVNLAKIIP